LLKACSLRVHQGEDQSKWKKREERRRTCGDVEIAYAGEAQRGTRDTTDMRAFIDVFVTYNELVMMVVSGEKDLEYLKRASQRLDIKA